MTVDPWLPAWTEYGGGGGWSTEYLGRSSGVKGGGWVSVPEGVEVVIVVVPVVIVVLESAVAVAVLSGARAEGISACRGSGLFYGRKKGKNAVVRNATR